jgi:hypothetical protein
MDFTVRDTSTYVKDEDDLLYDAVVRGRTLRGNPNKKPSRPLSRPKHTLR